MLGWYTSYKLADSFYRCAMAPAARYREVDLPRWGRLHMLLADEVGLDKSDPEYIDKFFDLSKVFAELTDQLGRLPHKSEFISAWQTWLDYKRAPSDIDIDGAEEVGIDPEMAEIDEVVEPLAA